MIKRIIEIILGLVIGLSLFSVYSDETHKSKLVIWYVLTPTVLQYIAWIALFFVSGRLIGGEYKNYAKPVYNFLVKLLGDPKKVNKQ